MDTPVTTVKTSLFRRWKHKLFECPTFWSVKPKFKCPLCGTTYRCYWDGNDAGGHINLCDPCANTIEAAEAANVEFSGGASQPSAGTQGCASGGGE